MVADDESAAVVTMAQLLRDRGHTVCTATDGRSALEVAVHFCPQVSVLDIGMPQMTGHEVARSLRRLPRGREMLLIAVSGWGERADKALAREAGFDYHLTKPADFEQLLGLIEGAADTHKPA